MTRRPPPGPPPKKNPAIIIVEGRSIGRGGGDGIGYIPILLAASVLGFILWLCGVPLF